MAKLIGIGAGGHAKVVVDILQRQPGTEIVGLLDSDPRKFDQEIGGIRVIDDVTTLEGWRDRVDAAFIGVGTARDTMARQRIYATVCEVGLPLADAIHSTACISPSASLGHGITILAGAVINADALVGNNVLINTRAIVEHDCVICDHAHIACGACIAGGVIIEHGALIGAGAVVLPGVRIGRNTVIGAGTLVVRDAPSNVVMVGSPAHVLRRSA